MPSIKNALLHVRTDDKTSLYEEYSVDEGPGVIHVLFDAY